MKPIYFLIPLIIFICCNKNISETETENASLLDLSIFESSVKIDSTLIITLNNPDLTAFYKNYKYETVWISKENRDAVLLEFKNATNDGLLPLDYNYQTLSDLNNKFSDLDDPKIIDFDLLFTQSLQKYISHIYKGKIPSRLAVGEWDLKEKKIDVNAIIFKALEDNEFALKFENCKPQHPIYKSLKEALTLLNNLPKDTIPFIQIKPKDKFIVNKPNKFSKIIKTKLMYWDDMKKSDSITNIFDKETFEALKLFQARHGLFPDGIIGKGTVMALNFTKDQRAEQIIANLERWRWFSNDFGKNYLLINIPDYTIAAIKDNDTMQKQRVVVGKESRQTPVIESKVSNINLNPNWTVPPTILKEDVYPDAILNRGAFKKKGLVILDNKNKEVNPWSWKLEDAKKYKYVQNPGRNSALGSMKVNFPNKYSVYLHDTNHRDFFKLTYRSLSSGCVRLEKPLEMAAYIINDTVKWKLQRIKDTTDINYYNKLQKIKEKKLAVKNAKLLAKNPLLIIPEKVFAKPELKTIVVSVKDEVLIHQLYWTAWLKNGKLQFREDIYCLDYDLYSKLSH
jgi:L,D-transpeptidase YcbB